MDPGQKLPDMHELMQLLTLSEPEESFVAFHNLAVFDQDALLELVDRSTKVHIIFKSKLARYQYFEPLSPLDGANKSR